jgi:drug/metabolite transporter (DMT)-like permease
MSSAPLSDNARGAALMAASMAGFVANDALMKAAFETTPFFPAILVRGLLATVMIAALAAARGVLAPPIARSDRPLIALRVATEVGATLCFLTALVNMPIANATAVLQALPLTVTLGAALLLGEPVGWRRWAAIGVGLAGVLIMLRPGPDGFDAHALWALGAVACVTVRDLVTRRLSRGAPSVFIALLTAVAITLTGAVGSLGQPWPSLAPATLATLAAAAAFLLVGYLTGVAAMRVGEVAAVSPFRYTVLLWAMLLGWLFFGETPGPWMLSGAAVVVAAGLYTLHRERVAGRRRLAAGAGGAGAMR